MEKRKGYRIVRKKIGGLTLANLKTYYKDTVIKKWAIYISIET